MFRMRTEEKYRNTEDEKVVFTVILVVLSAELKKARK